MANNRERRWRKFPASLSPRPCPPQMPVVMGKAAMRKRDFSGLTAVFFVMCLASAIAGAASKTVGLSAEATKLSLLTGALALVSWALSRHFARRVGQEEAARKLGDVAQNAGSGALGGLLGAHWKRILWPAVPVFVAAVGLVGVARDVVLSGSLFSSDDEDRAAEPSPAITTSSGHFLASLNTATTFEEMANGGFNGYGPVGWPPGRPLQVGDRVPVMLENAVFGNILAAGGASVGATIIEDHGSSWLVKLGTTVQGVDTLDLPKDGSSIEGS